MADKHESKEAEVSLSLSMEDWGWLLNYVLTGVRLQLRPDSPARIQVERIVAHLDGQYHYHRHKAASPPEPRPTYREVFDQVHKAGGHAWDKPADPRKFLNEECR